MKKMGMTDKTVFIIDGSSFLYRAYYALKPMYTPEGTPVNAVYGFCRILKKLITDYDMSQMIIAWDSATPSERSTIYPEYKMNRQKSPHDLHMQKTLIKEFIDLLRVCQIQKESIEADDIMYSLAIDFEKRGYSVVVVTADKDLRQIVSDTILIYDTLKQRLYDREALEKLYGFSLKKLIFYFALIGDSSDNIPGVKGIGPKTAEALVKNFDSLDMLYQNIESIEKARIKTLLIDQKEYAYLSQKLFSLQYYPFHDYFEIPFFQKSQWELATPFFKKLHFLSMIDKNEWVQIIPSKEYSFSYTTVVTEDDLIQLSNAVITEGMCAVDTETTALNPHVAQLVGISISCYNNKAWYIPIHHMEYAHNISLDMIKKYIGPLLNNAAIKKFFHNAKYDYIIFYLAGMSIKNISFDTMVAAYILTPEGQKLNLKHLSLVYLNQEMLSYEMILSKENVHSFAEISVPLATEYAAGDAHQTWQLTNLLEKKLNDHGVRQVFETIELPLIQVLSHMEMEGIFLNTDILATMNQRADHELVLIKQRVIDLLGPEFETVNLNSPKQIETILFSHLKLTPVKKTTKKTGYSTDQEVLTSIAKQHPVAEAILRYRELHKLKSTYLATLETYVNPFTKKIHPSFQQTVTATGRLSCSQPNLQNIPSGTIGNLVPIRSAFQPNPGDLFLSVDYSQIELRILAYLSQDDQLIHAFLYDQDIHKKTAAALFDVSQELVNHEQRQIAKRVNFSIIYGLTPYGLAKDLQINYHEAESYIKKFFLQYPKLKPWMDTVIDETKQYGYVTTLYGRRRYIPGIYEKNKSLYELAHRVAINTKVQGTAADLMKKGMIMVSNALQKKNSTARMILQIHDELLITDRMENIEETRQFVKSILQNLVSWNVALQVTTRIGDNWASVTK